MPPNEYDATIQRVQTEHRLNLANFWDIKTRSKVLEIGCGQGDTTAVLAHLVGAEGFVHGIDIASPNYGSPVTLGESIQFLQNSSLGNRIQIDFETNILSPDINFPKDSFDFIVLSHCSWYFKSPEELFEILKKIKDFGKTLCFAEWDTRITTNEQLPHFLSVLIQAQYECFKENSFSNIRTLFTPIDIQTIAKSAGWNILTENTIDSSQLQDGKWEIEQTLLDYEKELLVVDNLPAKFKALFQSQIYLLEAAINRNEIKSMSTYAFAAK
ncbi:class I SAM-dependent methyltransferase [Psychrobacillus vulpis]|uniref:Class I SAM-dependent methyltransferase n=1 Tax=Psychrobacillus vulpis TaxID=2325572 RepID=A0A544TSK4_9BACI|nr:class I SAM-dependent methyltransferase [Psychrobacillus vulpis]